MQDNRKRVLALYLPQFHPIPENNKWWGPGFTEWTNVGKAQPLYRGHYQPRIPRDLGYYDLRVSETREHQAYIAKSYGIDAFCYWHYWFGSGKRLLERPFEEVLLSGKPDFPFCLAWANESWRGFHHGLNNERETLIEQTYPGEDDYIAHFECVVRAFQDPRYVKVDGKPFFMIYQPYSLPNAKEFINLWRALGAKHGLMGIHFVAQTYAAEKIDELKAMGFDAVNIVRMYDYAKHQKRSIRTIINALRHRYLGAPRITSYRDIMQWFVGQEDQREDVYPTIIPNWDHTPRTGNKGLVFDGSTPDTFAAHLKDIDRVLQSKKNEPIVILKSWNEWAEGNYVEPDLKFGFSFLEQLRDFVNR